MYEMFLITENERETVRSFIEDLLNIDWWGQCPFSCVRITCVNTAILASEASERR